MGNTPFNPPPPPPPPPGWGGPQGPYDPQWQRMQARAAREQANAYRDQARAARRAQAAAARAQAAAARQQWRLYRGAYRRSSVVGPLLLIAVGSVALLLRTGRIEWLPFVTWYGHWWPLLLIGIGLLRLAEWAIDRARSTGAPPRYTVGGGTAFAVVLLVLTGISASGFDRHRNEIARGLVINGENFQQFLGSKHEEDSPLLLHAIAPGANLLIDNPRGEVVVSGTSDDGQLHLNTHKELYSGSDGDAAKSLAEFSPAIGGSDADMTLRLPARDGATADLNLLVPPGVRLVVNANRGDVHVSGMKAPVTVNANNGDVEIAAISADTTVHINNRNRSLTVRSVAGTVDAEGSGDEVNVSDVKGTVHVGGDFFGGGHLQRINGPIHYDSDRLRFSLERLDGEVDMDERDSFSASEVVGPLTVETRSRNITLSRVSGDVHVTNNHGDVEVTAVPPTGSLTINNRNGAVTLSLPEKARFSIDASTSDGDATSDFSGLQTDRGVIRGSVNGGGSVVHATTSHGDISLRRNSDAPLPPQPPPPPTLTGADLPPLQPLVPEAAIKAAQRRAAADAKKAAAEAKKAEADARKTAAELKAE